MKILIVDDQSRRYEKLVDSFGRIGIDRKEIDIAISANDARDRLGSVRYDLLVLDILLPLWSEREPDVQYSIDLLVELHEGEEYYRPRHIIGISSDKEVAGRAFKIFQERTWTIVEYSHSTDDWMNKILNCVLYIKDKGKNNNPIESTHKIDLAIICALEKPELEEVLKLPWHWSAARPLDDIIFAHDGYFEIEGRRFSVCATSASRMGMVSTALRSAAVISLLRPRLIAMCGICAGVKGKVNIGDVILADPAWDFQSGKRVRDKGNVQFSVSPHHLCAPVLVRTHVEQIAREKEALRSIADQFTDPSSDQVRVVIGPLASGSAVLADGEVVNEIKSQHRELFGVEMEVYGMYAAAYSASSPRPLPFALKAVCDFADPDKNDKHQRYAAYTSANVLRLLMEKYASRLIFPI